MRIFLKGFTSLLTLLFSLSALAATNNYNILDTTTISGGVFVNPTISGTVTLPSAAASTLLMTNGSRVLSGYVGTSPSQCSNSLVRNFSLSVAGQAALSCSQVTNSDLAAPVSTAKGGLGLSAAASTGIPVFTAGSVTFASTTGTGNVVLATSPTLVTPALGTPSSIILTNGSGLPIASGVSGLGTGIATFLGTPSSANLATAVTDETGSGALVFATSPTLVTPALGTPSSGTLTNATGLPISTGVSGLGTGIATALGVSTGSAGAPVLFNGALGTPSSGTLTSATGLPISTGVSGLGTGVATFLATPTSANLATAVTNETGSGALVFATSPTFGGAPTFNGAGPVLFSNSSDANLLQWLGSTSANNSYIGISAAAGAIGDAAAGDSVIRSDGKAVRVSAGNNGASSQLVVSSTGVSLVTPTATSPSNTAGSVVTTNGTQTLTNKTIAGASNTLTVRIANDVSGLGTGIATALAVNTGSAGAPVLFNGALGTPSSGTLTSATGLPISTGVSGLGTGIATALAVNTGSAGAPVLVNGALGTPSSGTLTSATGLPVSTGISGFGTGIATALAVNIGSAGAPILFNGALGTPSSGTLTSATGLPISTGVSGLGTGVATFLATPSSANFASAITDELGTGNVALQSQAAWTPTDASGAGLSFTASGYYVRTGDMMHAMGTVTFPATGSGASVQFGSLPCTAKNVTANRGGTVTFTDLGSIITARSLENTASVFLYDVSGSNKTNVQLTGKTVNFTVTYVCA